MVKKGFLEILNSKLVIGILIFIMLSLATVFAGDMIFDSGNLNVSSVFYVNESSGRVGIGTTTPTHTLNVVGSTNITNDLLVNGVNMSAYITTSGWGNKYETGWINRSDWTNVHIGSSTTKNADSNVTHNLNAPLSNLIVKLFISPTGADTDAFEIGVLGAMNVNIGFTIFYVDANNILIHTSTSGCSYVQTTDGTVTTIDTENWYYKIKIWKLG